MVFIILTVLSAGIGLGSALILQLRATRSYQCYPLQSRPLRVEPIVTSESSLHNR